MGCISSVSAPEDPPTKIFKLEPRKDGSKQVLWTVIAHFNPKSYKTRARLTQACLGRLMNNKRFFETGFGKDCNLALEVVVVELLYNEATSELNPPTGCHVIRRSLSNKNLMWSKEQLLNLGMKDIPSTDYVAWIDGDIEFPDPSWALHAVKTLMDKDDCFIQLFQTASLLNASGKPFENVQSFAFQHAQGKPYSSVANTDTKNYWHPGFAWAAHKTTLTKTDLLMDRTLGSADLHMACAFLDDEVETIPEGVSEGYKRLILAWQNKCRENKLKLACTSYTKPIRHHWHGSMKNRQYVERWQIVIQNSFDPFRDCRFDEEIGLFVYSDACPAKLLSQMNDFFEKRAEDSREMDETAPKEHESTRHAGGHVFGYHGGGHVFGYHGGGDDYAHRGNSDHQHHGNSDHHHHGNSDHHHQGNSDHHHHGYTDHSSKPSYWGGYS